MMRHGRRFPTRPAPSGPATGHIAAGLALSRPHHEAPPHPRRCRSGSRRVQRHVIDRGRTGVAQRLATQAAPVFTKVGTGIEGDYIVVFKDAVSDVLTKADEKILRHGGTAKFKYDKALKGFAATLLARRVAMLRNDPDVAFIEQDGVVAASTTQSGATWGIDRIDQRALPLSGTYTYTSTGAGRDGVHHRHRHPDQPSASSAAARRSASTRSARQRPGLQRPRHARRRHGWRQPPTGWPRARRCARCACSTARQRARTRA